ncbi:MAG TPA: hypothetical protein VJ837_03005 [Candidatus Paceibacterota bacterium]|nr:hypothetical protein [Candidatus Paceibacterota bacterium]
MQAWNAKVGEQFRTLDDPTVYTRVMMCGATACSGGTYIHVSRERQGKVSFTTLPGHLEVVLQSQ